MTSRSIPRAAITAALMAVAAVPALAQDEGSPQQQSADGGFASRDAVPPDASLATPRQDDEDRGWNTWHDDPQDTAGDNELDADPQPAPGTVNSFNQPEATPGFQASTGIDNRDQAVSACLAAVRARVDSGAGAARVDGIRGEWMVSGAIADGRAFYCAIHDGAIDDVEFGS